MEVNGFLVSVTHSIGSCGSVLKPKCSNYTYSILFRSTHRRVGVAHVCREGIRPWAAELDGTTAAVQSKSIADVFMTVYERVCANVWAPTCVCVSGGVTCMPMCLWLSMHVAAFWTNTLVCVWLFVYMCMFVSTGLRPSIHKSLKTH